MGKTSLLLKFIKKTRFTFESRIKKQEKFLYRIRHCIVTIGGFLLKGRRQKVEGGVQ